MAVLSDEFPGLWQKPAFHDLLDCLKKLEVKPPVWGYNTSQSDILKAYDATLHQRRQISSFLSSVISSNLTWIDTDEQREELWNEASRRLAERCGRTAMGEITRAFPFRTEDRGPFDLTIREPPLTGDALGLKTWGSSYVLAQMLPWLGSSSLAHLIVPGLNVLELGSGTGLLGLAAACFWRLPVMLTDLPTIMPNLINNVERNRPVVGSMCGTINAAPLTWGNPDETDARFQEHHQYKLVIVADPLYDDDHPVLLAGALQEQMSLSPAARALVMVPLRDEMTKILLSSFQKELLQKSQPLVLIEHDIVLGQDDWGEDADGQHMECWWGIFKRQEPTAE